MRVLVLTALALLTVYTGFAAWRLAATDRRGSPASAGAVLRARADLLAARVDVEVARLQAGAAAGASALGGAPADALDAAELALRIAAPTGRAAAVVGSAGLLAQTGAPGARWTEAAAAAGEAGRSVWIGALTPAAAGGPRLLYLARVVQSAGGRATVLLAADLSALTEAQAGEVQAVAGADGRLLALDGDFALPNSTATSEALGLSPAETRVEHGQERQGLFPNGRPARVALAPAADHALTAAVATPAAAFAADQRRSMRDGIVALIAPLLFGLILSLVLLRQTRRTEQVHRDRLETERRFRLAVEAARCGIWEWRLREETVYLSDVTAVMLGWGGAGVVAAEDLIGRIAPEHRERVRQALRGAQTHGAFDVSFRVPGPGGESAWIDARGQAFGPPDKRGYDLIIGVALDVTAERTSELRVQQAERRLQDAIESVSDGFILFDRGGRLLLCNQPFRDFFNIEPRLTKPGAPRKALLQVAELAIKNWRRTTQAAVGVRGVREVELHDGRWLLLSERRTADDGLVMTAADITAIKLRDEARRVYQEQLEAAVVRLEESGRQLERLAEENDREKMRAEQANRAKSEFLANMSHELRTPLNAINGFSEMMVGEMFGSLGDSRYRDYAADILASGQHLLALINDILDMSKIEAGKLTLRMEPVDVRDVVDDAVRLMRNRAEAAGLTLSAEVEWGLPELTADYRALKQVLLNLLSNSLKFTPRGGRVILAAVATDGGVRISVADTGIGISEDDIARLARPFEQIENQTSKTTQGTGLGLALTKSLIGLHHGSMHIASAPGAGTTVSFTLPVDAAAQHLAPPRTEAA